jgi:hypothetical protein
MADLMVDLFVDIVNRFGFPWRKKGLGIDANKICIPFLTKLMFFSEILGS